MAIGDEPLARVEPVDDRLGQDVEQEVVRASPFSVELAPDPVEQPRVGVADLLDLAQRGLDPPDAPGQASVLLAEIVGESPGVGGWLVGHVPRSRVVNVSLKYRLEAVPRTGPISPKQYRPAIGSDAP